MEEKATVTFSPHTLSIVIQRTEEGLAIPMGLRRWGRGVLDLVVLKSINTFIQHFTRSPEASSASPSFLPGFHQKEKWG